MIDLTCLLAEIVETRTELFDREARERDRRLGLTAMRPAIDYLEAHVLPELDTAKAELSQEGIRLDIADGWSGQAKRPEVEILCIAGSGWPTAAEHTRSRRVIIAYAGGKLSVRSKPFADPESVGEPVEVEEGAEVDGALRHAVQTFLEPVRRGPTMHGEELRRVG
jgi:hypothetical protein